MYPQGAFTYDFRFLGRQVGMDLGQAEFDFTMYLGLHSKIKFSKVSDQGKY